MNIYNSWVSSLFETVPGSLIRSVQKRRQRYYTSSQNYYNCVGVYQVIVYSVNKWHGKTTDQCQNVESTNYNFLVTFIKSLNQSNIKPCLIVHLVAMWTLIRLRNISRPKLFSKNYKFFFSEAKNERICCTYDSAFLFTRIHGKKIAWAWVENFENSENVRFWS